MLIRKNIIENTVHGSAVKKNVKIESNTDVARGRRSLCRQCCQKRTWKYTVK